MRIKMKTMLLSAVLLLIAQGVSAHGGHAEVTTSTHTLLHSALSVGITLIIIGIVVALYKKETACKK